MYLGETLEVRLALSATEQMAGLMPHAEITSPAAEAWSASAWSIADSGSLLSASAGETLASAVEAGSQGLVAFASGGAFDHVVAAVFGSPSSAAVSSLRDDLEAGRFVIDVEVISGEVLGTTLAGYAASGPAGTATIYVNADWLNAGADVTTVATVLVEEFGHAIDRRLNADRDTPGDEGEAFAAAVLGKTLTEVEAARIAAEDDFRVIEIGGLAVSIEQATANGINSSATFTEGGLLRVSSPVRRSTPVPNFSKCSSRYPPRNFPTVTMSCSLVRGRSAHRPSISMPAALGSSACSFQAREASFTAM